MTPFHEQLTITNDFAYLAQVRDLVRRSIQQSGFPAQFLNRLQIAVDEAVTNIIEHGYADQPCGTATIELRIDVNHERYRIEIDDQGMTFDPNTLNDVDIERHVATGNSGGLGVFLMRKIMDQVDYHYKLGQKNRLILIKHLPPARPDEPPGAAKP
jgi:serine/threonine-protein kinase RsbW